MPTKIALSYDQCLELRDHVTGKVAPLFWIFAILFTGSIVTTAYPLVFFDYEYEIIRPTIHTAGGIDYMHFNLTGIKTEYVNNIYLISYIRYLPNKAVDFYFENNTYLGRIDYTGQLPEYFAIMKRYSIPGNESFGNIILSNPNTQISLLSIYQNFEYLILYEKVDGAIVDFLLPPKVVISVQYQLHSNQQLINFYIPLSAGILVFIASTIGILWYNKAHNNYFDRCDRYTGIELVSKKKINL